MGKKGKKKDKKKKGKNIKEEETKENNAETENTEKNSEEETKCESSIEKLKATLENPDAQTLGDQEKEAVIENGVEEKKESDEKKKSSTLTRVKERFSTRKTKKQKNEKSEEKINDTNVTVTENNDKNADTEAIVDHPEQEDTKDKKDEKEKSETFIQRLLNLFRSKKKNGNKDKDKDKTDTNEEEPKVEDEIVQKEQELTDEDKEVLAICGDEKEEPVSPSVPTITTTKPPLPVSRRVPVSATTAHTRLISSLDEALKQFKMSTAASRENLRNSRQNLDQMEEQVKVMIRSRPATPLLSLRHSQVLDSEARDNKISSSLTDLRS